MESDILGAIVLAFTYFSLSLPHASIAMSIATLSSNFDNDLLFLSIVLSERQFSFD